VPRHVVDSPAFDRARSSASRGRRWSLRQELKAIAASSHSIRWTSPRALLPSNRNMAPGRRSTSTPMSVESLTVLSRALRGPRGRGEATAEDRLRLRSDPARIAAEAAVATVAASALRSASRCQSVRTRPFGRGTDGRSTSALVSIVNICHSGCRSGGRVITMQTLGTLGRVRRAAEATASRRPQVPPARAEAEPTKNNTAVRRGRQMVCAFRGAHTSCAVHGPCGTAGTGTWTRRLLTARSGGCTQ